MREIELIDDETFSKRLENIRKSFEIIYDVQISTELVEVALERLLPTEAFLEKDKLALVFKKIIEENYNTPIIVVECEKGYGILDGHHRAYIWRKLDRSYMKAYALKFPPEMGYAPNVFPSLEALPIMEVSKIDDQYLLGRSHILTLLKYYEAIYEISFIMKEDYLPLDRLVPTQPFVDRARLNSMGKILVPITCIKHDDMFYILDGHVRTLAAKRDGYGMIHSIILSPTKRVEFGIVKTAEAMKLKSLDDVKVI